jgi:L-asparaginase
MEYKAQISSPKVKPRLIIHGGAGNITPANLPEEQYHQYRHALLTVVSAKASYGFHHGRVSF